MPHSDQMIAQHCLSKFELEVLKRHDAGQSREDIARDMGVKPGRVTTALSLTSETEGRNLIADLHRGNSLFLAAMAEAQAQGERRQAARELASTCKRSLPLDRPAPVQAHPISGHDARPPAASREPCPYCQTRGDLGCAHFAPCEPVPVRKLKSEET